MSTRFEYPAFQGNANRWLRVNPTENGVLWDNGVGPPGSGYNTVLDNGVARPQRSNLDFVNYFTITDNGTDTIVNIDVVALAGDTNFTTALANDTNFITQLIANTAFTTALANDTNFITNLVANTAFTTALANDTNFYTTLANNTSFITALTSNANFITDITNIVNNAGATIQIDLTTQVTGILPLINGGTGAALSTPAGNRLWGFDTIDGSIVFINIGTNLSFDHATHTLNATGGSGSGEIVQKVITQVAHGFTVGQVLRSSGVDGEFALAQANTPANADIVGIVTTIVDANNFVLSTEGFEILTAGLPGGAATGDNLYLSSSVAGALTLTEPVVAGTVSQPVGRLLNDTTGLVYIHNWRGIENQALPIGAGTYTINADESVSSWFTTVTKIIGTTGPTTDSFGWLGTVSNGTISGSVIQADGTQLHTNTTGPITVSYSAQAQFDTSTDARYKFRAYVVSVDGREFAQIGFANMYFELDVNSNDVSAVTTNGGTTTTILAGILPTVKHDYAIVFNGTTAEFWVDGILTATHTTNVPATIATLLYAQQLVYAGGSGGTAIVFISEMTLATKI